MIPSPTAYPPNYEDRFLYKHKKRITAENSKRDSTSYRSPWEDIHPLLTHLQSHCTKLTAQHTNLSTKLQKVKRSVNVINERVENLEEWQRDSQRNGGKLKKFSSLRDTTSEDEVSEILNDISDVNKPLETRSQIHRYMKDQWRIWQSQFEYDIWQKVQEKMEPFIKMQIEKRLEKQVTKEVERRMQNYVEKLTSTKIEKYLEANMDSALEKKLYNHVDERIRHKMESSRLNQSSLSHHDTKNDDSIVMENSLHSNQSKKIISQHDFQKQIKSLKRKQQTLSENVSDEMKKFKEILQQTQIREIATGNSIENIHQSLRIIQNTMDALQTQVNARNEQEFTKLENRLNTLQQSLQDKIQERINNLNSQLTEQNNSSVLVDISNKIEDRLQRQLHQNFNQTNNHIMQLYREQEADTKLAIKQLIEKNKEFLVRTAAALKKRTRRSKSTGRHAHDSSSSNHLEYEQSLRNEYQTSLDSKRLQTRSPKVEHQHDMSGESPQQEYKHERNTQHAQRQKYIQNVTSRSTTPKHRVAKTPRKEHKTILHQRAQSEVRQRPSSPIKDVVVHSSSESYSEPQTYQSPQRITTKVAETPQNVVVQREYARKRSVALYEDAYSSTSEDLTSSTDPSYMR